MRPANGVTSALWTLQTDTSCMKNLFGQELLVGTIGITCGRMTA